LLSPGAAAAGHWLPGALGHDLRDIVIAEPEVLADEGTGIARAAALARSQDSRILKISAASAGVLS
jgi:hypothetical protein